MSAETIVLCSNCTNGNHTGSNGTPGCTGGSCACPCRACGHCGDVAVVPDEIAELLGGDPLCVSCARAVFDGLDPTDDDDDLAARRTIAAALR